jgi:hypothetical protein
MILPTLALSVYSDVIVFLTMRFVTLFRMVLPGQAALAAGVPCRLMLDFVVFRS